MKEGVIWPVLRSLFFRLDAETAHNCSFRVIKSLAPFPGLLESISGARPLRGLERSFCGLKFQGPLGLAAGFDKNAELLEILPRLGFDYVELGTVTPRPQEGNPKPRLLRSESNASLFNRMGFNSEGLDAVVARVRAARPELREGFRVGVNIGTNKETPADRAVEDYRQVASGFKDLADYFVVNVSSPNTPGLRDLQRASALEEILISVREEIPHSAPLGLKLAPELGIEDLKGINLLQEKSLFDFWVMSNTLKGKTAIGEGGWSGRAVQAEARKSLESVRMISKAPVVSVGGIDTADEAKSRIKAGADLIQIYTSWVYEGPRFPMRIKKALLEDEDS